jgi:transposase
LPAAYEPAVMLALLLYAYARGARSWRVIERACVEDVALRVIERACVEDVALRVIAAQRRPDHARIARFLARHQQALADVFGWCWGCARGLG